MGQQQLLLIVLGVIIVGTAVVLAIVMFQSSAIQSKRDLVMNESLHIAALAQTYYKKPYTVAGGGQSFNGWDIPEALKLTASGSYSANVNSDKVIIIGTGNEIVTGNDSVKVQITVTATSVVSQTIN